MNDALLVAYGLSEFPKKFSVGLFGGPSGPNGSIDLFLYPITATCGDGTLTLECQLLGGLTLEDQTGVSQTRGVLGRLDIQVAPQFSLVNTDPPNLPENPGDPGAVSLLIALSPADLTVTSWTYEVVLGAAYPADLQTYLAGDDFLLRLQAMIQTVLQHTPITIPALPLSFVGGTLLAAIDLTALATKFVPGALMLGLNVSSFTTSGGDNVVISGDVADLADFGGSHQIAAAINPAAIPVLLQIVENKIRSNAASSGATVDSLNMVAGDGKFEISASASASHATVTMSFSVVPVLTGSRPAAYFADKKPVWIKQRTFAALGFMPVDVNVSAGTGFWVSLFEIFIDVRNGAPVLGWQQLLQKLGDEADEVKADIEGASTGGASPRLQRFTPTNPGNVTVKVLVDEFQISPDEIFTGLTVTLEPLPAALIGPRTIPSNLLAQSLTYTARLPLGTDPQSGALRIVWTVTDAATATVLYDDDDAANGRTTYTLVPESLAPQASSLVVGCRVYTALNLQAPDILNDQITLQVGPPRPPGAYVSWRYAGNAPQVRLDQPSQSWIYSGRATVQRWSKIHRTDHPCQNASKHSRYLTEIEPFDELPFPISQIDGYRTKLCDYCFYGGPAGLRVSL